MEKGIIVTWGGESCSDFEGRGGWNDVGCDTKTFTP